VNPSALPDLAPIIDRMQSRFIRLADPSDVFDPLLPELLQLTDSGYGLIGEVWRDETSGAPFLKVFSLTDISWDDATRETVRTRRRDGIEFRNLDNLLGAPVRLREPVIANDPAQHAHSRGLPRGHPGMTAYLGMPLFHGGELVGMAGLANRPGGYDHALVEALNPLWSALGAIIGAVQMQRDRQQALAAQQASASMYRAVFDAAPVGIVRIGMDARIIHANPRYCEMLGYALDELVDRTYHHVTVPEDAVAQDRLAADLATGRIGEYRLDKRYRRRDGSVLHGHMTATLVRDAHGAPDHVIAIVEDVSERHRSLELLRQRDERLAKLSQQVPGVIYQLGIDPQGRVSMPYASPALRDVFEIEPADVQADARALYARIVPEHRQQFTDSVRHSMTTLREWRGEFEIDLPERGRRWIEGHSRAERMPDGGTRWHGYMADITERKLYEQAMLAAAAAERANAAKTEFLSRMSHELRTPLNAVLGFAQLLRMDRHAPLAGSQRQRVQHIERAGAHLLAMINDVLDLSRIEAGAVSLSIETLQVQPVVDEALEMVANAAREAGVTLHHAAGPPAYLRGDRVRLRQVLVNLLSNAIKYNRRGGRVDVSGRSDGDAVLLCVVDSGRGLEESQRLQLFQPFNRLGAERSDVEGTGIGLVITRRLVEMMRGCIEVSSRPGVGSVFSVRLPRAERPVTLVTGVDAGRGDVDNDGRLLRLLYVEDNPINVELVRQVLSLRPRVHLTVADCGARGIALARGERPDLLLVDMQLGDMSGLELAEALDRDPGTAAIPRVALSADAMPERVQAAQQRGFAPYLTKPLDVAALLRCVDARLDAPVTAA
jgi:PAS domain S-box-containing protein